MTQPIDRDLNRVILELAPRFEARDHAPSTFAELMAAPGIVWAGASDLTIYADPHVNHAFRAWHDQCHIAGGHDFSLAGETAACDMQCAAILARYPRAPRRWLNIIRAEVIGQAEYYAATGQFPVDQTAFIRTLIGGCDAN